MQTEFEVTFSLTDEQMGLLKKLAFPAVMEWTGPRFVVIGIDGEIEAGQACEVLYNERPMAILFTTPFELHEGDKVVVDTATGMLRAVAKVNGEILVYNGGNQ